VWVKTKPQFVRGYIIRKRPVAAGDGEDLPCWSANVCVPMSVRACMCECVRACVRVCVRACVRACRTV